MDRVISLFGFAVQGAKTNFWGLGCPVYCGQFPLSTFFLLFLLGWISGIFTVFWLLHPISSSASAEPPNPTVSVVASSRLAGYLHEQPPPQITTSLTSASDLGGCKSPCQGLLHKLLALSLRSQRHLKPSQRLAHQLPSLYWVPKVGAGGGAGLRQGQRSRLLSGLLALAICLILPLVWLAQWNHQRGGFVGPTVLVSGQEQSCQAEWAHPTGQSSCHCAPGFTLSCGPTASLLPLWSPPQQRTTGLWGICEIPLHSHIHSPPRRRQGHIVKAQRLSSLVCSDERRYGRVGVRGLGTFGSAEGQVHSGVGHWWRRRWPCRGCGLRGYEESGEGSLLRCLWVSCLPKCWQRRRAALLVW